MKAPDERLCVSALLRIVSQLMEWIVKVHRRSLAKFRTADLLIRYKTRCMRRLFIQISIRNPMKKAHSTVETLDKIKTMFIKTNFTIFNLMKKVVEHQFWAAAA